MTLATMTREHLGGEATAEDLGEFRALVERLIDERPDLTEEEAVSLLWNDGDYLAQAERLGLLPEDASA